jgi:hypothetical protein
VKIGVPVVCQNGHRAVFWYELFGLTWSDRGVSRDQQCDCPKHDMGQGWRRAEGEIKIEEPSK